METFTVSSIFNLSSSTCNQRNLPEMVGGGKEGCFLVAPL